MTNSLSLYTIEGALLELLTARAELAGQENPDPEELKQVDSALQEYIAKEISKVDGVYRLVKWMESQALEADAEAKERRAARDRILATVQRIKEMACAVMDVADKKRLDGSAGRYLLRKGNGGLEPLNIQQNILPAGLFDVTATLPGDVWSWMLRAWVAADRAPSELAQYITMREPSNSRIREALKEGPVAGVQVLPRGQHLELK